jgi:hypothetical protein
MKKIIFLDHDGVICLADNWGKWDDSSDPSYPDCIFDSFDEKAVKVLNEILEETNAEIVISSDWRFYASLEELKVLYTKRGIIKQPMDTTNLDPLGRNSFNLERMRAADIMIWVEENQLTPEDRWVAIDDLDLYPYLGKNFVHTPLSREGIKQSGKKEIIIKLLQSNESNT